MTDQRRLQVAGGGARLSPRRAAELAFLYRYTAEIERQLGGRRNWRSFTGIWRKRNAGWVGEPGRA
jgi:hypothetical protein